MHATSLAFPSHLLAVRALAAASLPNASTNCFHPRLPSICVWVHDVNRYCSNATFWISASPAASASFSPALLCTVCGHLHTESQLTDGPKHTATLEIAPFARLCVARGGDVQRHRQLHVQMVFFFWLQSRHVLFLLLVEETYERWHLIR